MSDPDRFEEACKQTVKHGNPTDTWMDEQHFPNGRYLEGNPWKDPYCPEALRDGTRENRDEAPLHKQTVRRLSAQTFLEEEIERQQEYDDWLANGLMLENVFLQQIKEAGGTVHLNPRDLTREVCWHVTRALGINKGTFKQSRRK